MTSTRTLQSPPSILPLYARAAAPMIPGASMLPFVPGGGGDVPEIELELRDVEPEAEKVVAYSRICGFGVGDALPATYPHVLAFPLHMAVMADGSFPFGAVGLVHVSNRIVQHRPIGFDETLRLKVRPTALEPHPRGRTFSLLTEAWAGRQKAWESVSTMLRRGGGDGSSSGNREPAGKGGGDGAEGGEVPGDGLGPTAEWSLGGDLGRRYAAVSGDRNPIHMHSLTAKPLGFPSAIAHGMWTKARCLAALDGRLPDAFAVDVDFRKPIRLPGRVELRSAAAEGGYDFAVRDSKRRTPHLDGRLRPVEAKTKSGGRKG